MSTKIQKWGNSLAVRLPQYLIEKLGLEAGTAVVIEDDRGKTIKITPMSKKQPKKKLSIAKLVNQITPANSHKEVDWGNPVGKEIW